MNGEVSRIINKALDGGELNAKEIATLFEVKDLSEESFAIQFAGRKLRETVLDGKAEVHGQVGINVGACGKDCEWCSFAARNKIFSKMEKFPHEDVVAGSLQMETEGANAIYLMATANYQFEDYLELGAKVKSALKTDVPLIANVGDFDEDGAKALKSAGFTGIYHAIRLGEGTQTKLKIEDRWKTVEAANANGLLVGTCLEPVGPEHTIEELVEKTIFTRQMNAVFSGAGRRINIPGSTLEKYGETPYHRLATIVAAVSLAIGTAIPGNCTHEPHELSPYAGANLIWSELGSNPRDTEVDTTRGWTTARCRELLMECGWDVLDGPSQMYSFR